MTILFQDLLTFSCTQDLQRNPSSAQLHKESSHYMCAYHETLLVQDISNNPAIWPDGGGIGIFQLLYYTSATLRAPHTTTTTLPIKDSRVFIVLTPKHICHWWPQKVQQKLDTLKNFHQSFLVYFQWNIETNLEKSMTESTLSCVH